MRLAPAMVACLAGSASFVVVADVQTAVFAHLAALAVVPELANGLAGRRGVEGRAVEVHLALPGIAVLAIALCMALDG